MKIFGFRRSCRCEDEYGMVCGVVIADSKEEALEVLEEEGEKIGDGSVFEIPFEMGYTRIGRYHE